MIIKNKGKRKEKKRKKYYEAVEELEVDGRKVDGRIAAVETGRVAIGVEERVELFVGGSTVEELEVDGRIASVEAGRVAKGVEVVELFVGGLAVEELEVDDRVAAVEAGRLTEGVDEKVAEGVDERIEQFVGRKLVPIPRRASSFLAVVFIHVNRKEEEEGETEQQFTKGCNILHRLQVYHLTLTSQ